MEIRFTSIKKLKSHIFGDMRAKDFEDILSKQAENENIRITVKTINHDHVENLDDLRYWKDKYYGSKTRQGIELYSKCQELTKKYGTNFVFEHVPIRNNDTRTLAEKVEAELLELKALSNDKR